MPKTYEIFVNRFTDIVEFLIQGLYCRSFFLTSHFWFTDPNMFTCVDIAFIVVIHVLINELNFVYFTTITKLVISIDENHSLWNQFLLLFVSAC